MALAGGSVDYHSQLFQLRRFRMAASPVQQRIPIYLASLGPKNLELTGELADGWLPIWVHQKWLPELKGMVAKAAARVGRDISAVTVAPQILCRVANAGEEMAEAECQLRAHLAYYIGGMGLYYYNLFRRYGYFAETDAIREAWAQRQRAKAAAAISDEMLENLTVFGDASACRAGLEQFRRNGADLPVIAFPHGSTLPAIQHTLEALAPRNAGSAPGPAP